MALSDTMDFNHGRDSNMSVIPLLVVAGATVVDRNRGVEGSMGRGGGPGMPATVSNLSPNEFRDAEC